jgi:hypothetical protein
LQPRRVESPEDRCARINARIAMKTSNPIG